ncbi:DUF4087 domain-containing protein [Bordetella petrii]|uniref:DUF4087 domain-containing protein n=1 Tax=Bordetella petrii TaxID=94624 RepID=UPI001A966066|nr:DUF4087 domain-containing protein [Bordetella petrii]MBO1111831.1 DUF4087 domain-containing protein [Bordetella petrii]
MLQKVPFAVTLITALTIVPISAFAKETRCGWIENDMPSGMSLTDKDGNWTIATMTEAASGFEQYMPPINKQEACGCLVVDTDSVTRRITTIYGGKVLQYKICKADEALK